MRPLSLGFVFLVLVGGVAAPTAAGPADPDGGVPALAAAGVAAQENPDGPRTTLRIDVERNGSARWTVVTRYPLSDANETAAFHRMVKRLERGDDGADDDAEAFRRFAARASDATGREMNITGVSYDGDVTDGVGRLNLSFRWTNFSNVTGDSIRVGDAFGPGDDGGATWFSSLGADQRLVVHPPEGYRSVSQTRFDKDGRTLYIQGPARFGANPPSVTYEPAESGIDLSAGMAVGGFGVALILAGAYLLRRRDAGISTLTSDGGSLLVTPADDADGEWAPAVGEGVTGDDAGVGAGSPAAAADPEVDRETGGADGDDGDEEDDDLSLLSDGERVERIIERNGGRMRQADVVAETGWSDAKVSQLLSRMADEGRVEKLRLGRENLISLPDEDDRDG